MSKIAHFEIPADDIKRAKGFYEKLFQWRFEDATMGSSEYWLIHTEEGAVGGGLIQRQNPDHRPANYISVESIDSSSRQVQELGGQVVIPKMAVTGMGWWAGCVDTEGNYFGIWQEDPQAK